MILCLKTALLNHQSIVFSLTEPFKETPEKREEIKKQTRTWMQLENKPFSNFISLN